MNEHFKDFFYFSRGEKNGIVVLLIILLLLIAAPYLSQLFINDEVIVNKEFEKEIELFSQSLQEVEEPTYNNRLNQYIIERYDSLKLFHFNPNNTSQGNFKKLGLTDKQIRTIENYLTKGGKFYVKEDFRKIYGIRHQQYQILKPYILLPEKEYYTANNGFSNKNELSDSLFVFDPNTTSATEFEKLGLSDKQVKTISNYLSKGGSFETKEDFKKIYGISTEQFNKLEPYIFIKESLIEKEKTAEVVQIVELNAATFNELIEIKGIKEYTAKAIINYREKMGGFYNINQLMDINSINKESFETYKSRFNVSTKSIKKLSLNFSEVEDFVAHPYLNYQQSKEIVEFRSKNGPYKSVKQLLDSKIILEGRYRKIKPYLTLN